MMRKTTYTLLTVLVLGVIILTGLPSCRKDHIQLSIKQYDSVQIQQYIAANGLTGFKKDTIGGDTTGIYYKIILPGYGNPIQYSDKLPFVYTERTFDGNYVLADTIQQHFYDFVGHLQEDGYPLGLQTAIHNLLIYPNAEMRVLIPSHLAYGTAGKGSGSSTVANNRIAGNQCMDWYIHAVNNFAGYDDMVIQKYMQDSSLTGYTKTASGLYYKVLIAGTSTDKIATYSSVTATYTGQLLDGVIFDGSHNGTNTLTEPVASYIPGVTEGLINYAVTGTKISLIMPSTIGYGLNPPAGIPPFAPLRFTFDVTAVTP